MREERAEGASWPWKILGATWGKVRLQNQSATCTILPWVTHVYPPGLLLTEDKVWTLLLWGREKLFEHPLCARHWWVCFICMCTLKEEVISSILQMKSQRLKEIHWLAQGINWKLVEDRLGLGSLWHYSSVSNFSCSSYISVNEGRAFPASSLSPLASSQHRLDPSSLSVSTIAFQWALFS